MKNTKEDILDAAENLFAEKGYAGTSIRAIVQEAGVNIAAISYHFNCKETLFFEVIRRRLTEVEKARFELLDQHLKLTNGIPTVEGIVRAFLEPLDAGLKSIDRFPKMLVRVFCESPDLKDKITTQLFQKTRKRFLQAFEQAYPHLKQEEIKWRFQFLIASMVGIVIFSDELQQTIDSIPGSKSIIEKAIQQTLYGIREEITA